MTITPLLQAVQASVRSLTTTQGFATWLASEKPRAGDLVVINNSFLNRKDLRTTQGRFALCLTLDSAASVPLLPEIVQGFGIKSDFKLLRKESTNLPERLPIVECVREHLDGFGRLPFILVGNVLDDVTDVEACDHPSIDNVYLNPALGQAAEMAGRVLSIRDTSDPDAVYDAAAAHLGLMQPRDETLYRAIVQVLAALASRSFARLVLPDAGGPSTTSVLAAVNHVLNEHYEQYQAAFVRCRGDASVDSSAFNELLRISYNFAADAGELIRLTLSLCDLKPLVAWGTLGAQYSLQLALASLPNDGRATKPSLKSYADTIGDARNSAFHHLFPFRKALHVDLRDGDLAAPSLRLFSEYAKRKDNQLIYRDKELVEVLIGFTRTRERRVPPAFWERNQNVMQATMGLFATTESTLQAVHRSTADGASRGTAA